MRLLCCSMMFSSARLSRERVVRGSLRTMFERLIDASDLDDRQREFLKVRWLEQLTWMESKAAKAQWFYYRLRLITIVGAVIVPALVALSSLHGWSGNAAQIGAWVVSLCRRERCGRRLLPVRSALASLPRDGRAAEGRGLALPPARRPLRDDRRRSCRRVPRVCRTRRGVDPAGVTTYVAEVATEKQQPSGSS